MTRSSQPTRHRFSTMGCPAELCVYAPAETAALQALRIARAEAQRLDHKYSHYREDSFLAQLQLSATQPGGQRVDPETAALLDFAACQYQQSEGRFDITAGRLTRLWQECTGLPNPNEIKHALASTGWNKVVWDGVCLQLPPGMQLDLGGIVKEYAADRVALLLREAGFNSGYIDLGGDLHILGPHPDGRPWKVGIRHPRKAGVLAGVDVCSGGLASSGDYERYRMIGGKRYSHIIDARSGWPVESLSSVSVIAPSCLMAGAISTLAMLLDSDDAMRFLAQSGLHWLGYDGTRHGSDFRSVGLG
jgi:thiamine biosynthesis lipoprotein